MNKYINKLFIFTLVILLAGSCSGILDNNKDDDGIDTPTGIVKLSIIIPDLLDTGAPSSSKILNNSRTVIPATSGVFSYDIIFTNDNAGVNKDLVGITDLTDLADNGKELTVGTWTVEITYKEKIDGVGDFLPVAYGSATFNVTAGSAGTVPVTLKPIPNGNGIFECKITCDISSVTGEIKLISIKSDGPTYTKTISSVPGSGYNAAWPELPAGEYDLLVSLTKTADGTNTGAFDVIHVYTGMKTTKVLSFSSSHFVDHVNLMGTLKDSSIDSNIDPVSVIVKAYYPNGTYAGGSELYDMTVETFPLTWFLSIDLYVTSVYFSAEIKDDSGATYICVMEDSLITGIENNGRSKIPLTPIIKTITAPGSIAVSGPDSKIRTAASPGETISLLVDHGTYGFDTGSLEVIKDGGGNITYSGSGYNYSFIMPDDSVTVSAYFYEAKLASVSIIEIPSGDTGTIDIDHDSGTITYKLNDINSTDINITATPVEAGSTISGDDPCDISYLVFPLSSPEPITDILVYPPSPGGIFYRTYTLLILPDSSF